MRCLAVAVLAGAAMLTYSVNAAADAQVEFDPRPLLDGATITNLAGVQPRSSPWQIAIALAQGQPEADVRSLVLFRSDANCGYLEGYGRLDIDLKLYWLVRLEGRVGFSAGIHPESQYCPRATYVVRDEGMRLIGFLSRWTGSPCRA
jgi:hypothetical protein